MRRAGKSRARRSWVAIAPACRQRRRQVAPLALQAEQSPGRSAPLAGSVRSGVANSIARQRQLVASARVRRVERPEDVREPDPDHPGGPVGWKRLVPLRRTRLAARDEQREQSQGRGPPTHSAT